MKKRYFFSFLALGALLFTSCDEVDYKEMTYMDDIRVSSSYVALPTEGGDVKLNLTTLADWTIEMDSAANTHEWLTVDPDTGVAGQTELSLIVNAAEGKTGTFWIHSGGKTQVVNVIQGIAQVQTATVKEVMDGAVGKTYRVTGTVTNIANTTYGNFYMNDGTSDTDLYIYGTLTPDGASKQWTTLGVEVGDIITVEGPKTLYGTTVELVDATFISVEKSLIKVGAVAPETGVLPLEGGEFTVGLTCKGQGISVDIPEDAKDWLTIAAIQSAADTATVKFNVAANNGGDRSTTLTFHTTDGVKDYTAQTTLTQSGAVVKVTTAEFIAAAVGDTQYRMKVAIEEIYNTKYGNLYVRDGYSADKLTIYGTTNFADYPDLKAWDIVTLVTPRAAYKDTPQGKNAVIEEVIPVTTVTAAEFNNLADDNEALYHLSGTVANIKNTVYGNFDIVDESGSAYIYGLLDGIDGATKMFESLGIKEGDHIDVITIKTSYKDSPQGKNAWYIKHTPAE